MRVVALLAVRNEALYLSRCLEHLYLQGIETCLIDNDSTDGTREIAHEFRDKGVFRIENLPFDGHYEWKKILGLKEQLGQEIQADWFIHHDADEIREAPKPYETLLEGIKGVDRSGYNAVNFDEFVFVPTSADDNYEGHDFVAAMRHYHFIEPSPHQRLSAWKKTAATADLTSSAGHKVQFPDLKLFPTNFILRHYIFLSHAHAVEKYGNRTFLLDEVKQGWHRKRAAFQPEHLLIPTPGAMCEITADGSWDKSDPWTSYDQLFGGHQS